MIVRRFSDRRHADVGPSSVGSAHRSWIEIEHLVARSPSSSQHRAVPGSSSPNAAKAADAGRGAKPAWLSLPQAGLHHPAPQRVRATRREAALQRLRKQRRPEAAGCLATFSTRSRNPSRQARFDRRPPARAPRPGIAFSLDPAQPTTGGHPDPRCSAAGQEPSLSHRDASLSFRPHLLLSRIQLVPSLTEHDPKGDISTSL